jgi:hypothetical protein
MHVGDVMGDVMGYDDDEVGADMPGASQLPGSPANQGALIRLQRPPGWRQNQVAQGVHAPQVGLVPLPLTPQTNGGVFTSTVTAITFQGTLQKPFRGERFLMTVVKTGTTATSNFVLGQIYVGTAPQQADITPLSLEPLGTGGSFDVRLQMIQANPGVLIRILATLQGPLTSPDTVSVSMQILGQVIH